MRAGLIEAPGVLKMVEHDIPKVEKDTDVLVKIKRVGICGSDMHIYHGKNAFVTYPRVWGHEFVGEVAETGSAVTAVKAGDHVVAEPILSCGECYACRQGRRNACQDLKVYGVHVEGGAQEYVVIPEKNAHIIPSDLPWSQAVLIEPFTIGAQACYRGNVQEGDVVFVMGAGTIGLTIMVNAKILGATVIISDIVDGKLEYAKKLGADHIINAKEVDVVKKVLEITEGMGANVTVDAVCSKESFEQAIDVTSTAGRVVEMSFNTTPSEIAPVKLAKGEMTIMGSRHQTGRFPVVIEYLKQGKLPLEGFANAEFSFDQMHEAFDYAEKNTDTVRKIILSME